MEGRPSDRPSWELASVRNAARLLKEYSRADRELGVSELARRLGLVTSTVHRLLRTLAAERLLEPGGAPGRYRLGLAVYDLGATVAPHLNLHEAALPVMAGLRHSTGETVQLAVLDGCEPVYIERLESPHTVRVFAHVGTRLRPPPAVPGRCCWPRCHRPSWTRGWPAGWPGPPGARSPTRPCCAPGWPRWPSAAGRRTGRRAGSGCCRSALRSGTRVPR
jgi:DNA-binding IclR family transcriptional regulator